MNLAARLHKTLCPWKGVRSQRKRLSSDFTPGRMDLRPHPEHVGSGLRGESRASRDLRSSGQGFRRLLAIAPVATIALAVFAAGGENISSAGASASPGEPHIPTHGREKVVVSLRALGTDLRDGLYSETSVRGSADLA